MQELEKKKKEAEEKFLRAGHKPEDRACDHSRWNFTEHGRYCPCGTIMMDFGD